jgi:hypothetical protein
MNNLPKSAISPLAIAQKLAAAHNLTEPVFAEKIRKEPRLVELLWFLQWTSTQPGGLDKFAQDVIAECAPQFGPPFVHDESAPLSSEQRKKVWEALPTHEKEKIINLDSWVDACDYRQLHERCWPLYGDGHLYPAPIGSKEQARFDAAFLKIPRQKFQKAFIDAAKNDLPASLRSICGGPVACMDTVPWYCDNLIDVLFEAMAAHAASAELRLARTEVVSLAFDRLDYAWQKKVLVKIEGDARTGKSEAIKAWCAMYPGRARLVATPSSNSLRDLILAIAEAIGLPFTPNVDTCDLKDRVQFIIRHSGLFLIFDEAHFLLPTSYGRNTNPARLDYVRTEIVDKDLPVALICTPQAFKHSVERFQKWTGYNFAQFLGRIMLNVTLPNELGEADLLAVTKIQGPDIPEKFHRFIVARAMQSEGYLKAIEAVCSRASYIASREGHCAVTLADVELAASEVMPAAPAPARPAPSAAPSLRNQPIAAKRSRPIRALAAVAPALQGPARQTSPAPAPALKMPSREIIPTAVLESV